MKNLAQVMDSRKVSAQELADALGVSKRAVYGMRSKSNTEQLDRLVEVATAIGCTTDELVGHIDADQSTQLLHKKISKQARALEKIADVANSVRL